MKKSYNKMPFTLSLILLLNFSLSACGGAATTDPTRTVRVQIPLKDNAASYNVSLKASSAAVHISDTAEQQFIGGFHYDLDELKTTIVSDMAGINATQNDFNGNIPVNTTNYWNLKLGQVAPLNLDIDAGAGKGSIDMGNLPLKTLNYKNGGDGTRIYFSYPNKIDLEELTVEAGKGDLRVAELGRARLKKATFICGEGDLIIDFNAPNGGLSQPINDIKVIGSRSKLSIYSGLFQAELIVDKGDPGLISGSSWTRSGNVFHNAYWDDAATGFPKLTIHVELNGGKVELI